MFFKTKISKQYTVSCEKAVVIKNMQAITVINIIIYSVVVLHH